MRRALFGTGQHVQTAEDDLTAAAAIPAGQFVSPFGKGAGGGDSDDFWHGRKRRAAVEKVFIPVFHVPVRGGRRCETGEAECWGEDMFAEAGVGVLRIKGIDQEGVARLDLG